MERARTTLLVREKPGQTLAVFLSPGAWAGGRARARGQAAFDPARGDAGLKVAPLPGPAESAVTSPPCARAKPRAMVSPMPEPLWAASRFGRVGAMPVSVFPFNPLSAARYRQRHSPEGVRFPPAVQPGLLRWEPGLVAGDPRHLAGHQDRPVEQEAGLAFLDDLEAGALQGGAARRGNLLWLAAKDLAARHHSGRPPSAPARPTRRAGP